jgi:hypothetical protein
VISVANNQAEYCVGLEPALHVDMLPVSAAHCIAIVCAPAFIGCDAQLMFALKYHVVGKFSVPGFPTWLRVLPDTTVPSISALKYVG